MMYKESSPSPNRDLQFEEESYQQPDLGPMLPIMSEAGFYSNEDDEDNHANKSLR